MEFKEAMEAMESMDWDPWSPWSTGVGFGSGSEGCQHLEAKRKVFGGEVLGSGLV